MTSLRPDLHRQDSAHAGRTTKGGRFLGSALLSSTQGCATTAAHHDGCVLVVVRFDHSHVRVELRIVADPTTV